MEKYDIYGDIAERTDGDIYVGVVGPVRTGKSTFVKRFAELFLIPNVQGRGKKSVASDELPQSGEGKTITTTEPKFIPGDGVKVSLRGKASAKMRLIDCVGFLIEGAGGAQEDGKPRMVRTPWDETPVPFEEAAERGTDKVIGEHSTIAVVVTTDGSVAGLPRANYVPAEEKTVAKLKEIGKPFAVVLNSSDPDGEDCKSLASSLSEKYGVAVTPMNVLSCGEDKFTEVMESVLYEFPLRSVEISLPAWMETLPPDNPAVSAVLNAAKRGASRSVKMKDLAYLEEELSAVDKILPETSEVIAGEGRAKIGLGCDRSLFYDVLGSICGETVADECGLMKYVARLSEAGREYEKISGAVSSAKEFGYGVSLPSREETEVEDPKVVRQGARYGVTIRANAECVHVMKVKVGVTVNPLSGTKEQCEEFSEFLKKNREENGLDGVTIFGKPLGGLIDDEIAKKADGIPADAKNKIRRNVTKMVNEGRYRIFCFLY